MHLKAIIPLLVLSSFFIIQCTALSLERKQILTNRPAPTMATTPITVGPYSMFATPFDPIYAYNADSDSVSSFPGTIQVSSYFSHTVIDNELFVFGGGVLVDDRITIFNVTSQETNYLRFNFYTDATAITSVRDQIIIAGGNTVMDYVGIYDTTTQTITNYTLPVPSAWMKSASVGDYAVFAAGYSNVDSYKESNNAFVFNTVTKTWTTTTINAFGLKVQSVTIGQYAIFVCGSIADIFDSNTQSWSTHTLTQNASISDYGLSITKTSRYAFFVGQGRADVFDSQSQSWSTLDIAPSTYATYCPATTVDNYALFACSDIIALYDTTSQKFVRSIRIDPADSTIIQAGSVGNIATFFGSAYPNLYIITLDLTVAPGVTSRVITPTPVSVPFSTHQLTSPRPSHYSVANKAVFVNNDDKTVEIYDPETESWSTSSPDSDSRGSLFTAADDFLVFSDKLDASVLHVFDAELVSWSIRDVSPQANRYLETAGNYLFYLNKNNNFGLLVYDITNYTWLEVSNSASYGYSYAITSVRYKSYAIFILQDVFTLYASAWNTVNGLESTQFSYGPGTARVVPSYGIAGDYFVIGGGVNTNLDPGFSINNPEAGETYTGFMPSGRYSATTYLYAKPLVMFVSDDLTVESFNVETQQWQSSSLEFVPSSNRVSVGNKLLLGYEEYALEFDSTTLEWSNISFAGSRVGTVFKLRDVASFVDSDNIVTFNPNNQQWTKVQLSVSSGTRLTEAFVVGDKVIVVSSDDLTVRVTDFDQLSSSVSAPTPTTPHSGATPSSPSTPTTVPWSPWTMPVSNTPTTTAPVSSTPTTTNTPVANTPSIAPLSTQYPPSTSESPTNNNAPTSVSSPSSSSSSSSSTDDSAEPVSGSNIEATSSSSTIGAISFVSMIAGVLLFL